MRKRNTNRQLNGVGTALDRNGRFMKDIESTNKIVEQTIKNEQILDQIYNKRKGQSDYDGNIEVNFSSNMATDVNTSASDRRAFTAAGSERPKRMIPSDNMSKNEYGGGVISDAITATTQINHDTPKQ